MTPVRSVHPSILLPLVPFRRSLFAREVGAAPQDSRTTRVVGSVRWRRLCRFSCRIPWSTRSAAEPPSSAIEHAHRGQRGSREARDRDVVEPGEREFLRHGAAGVAQGGEAADRHRVVRREDRRRRGLHASDTLSRAVAAVLTEVAGELQLLLVPQVQRRERVAIAAQALVRVHVGGGASDEGDPHVSERMQVSGHREGAVVVVDVDEVEAAGGLRRGVEQDHRDRVRDRGAQPGRREVRRKHDEPVDAAPHRAEDGAGLAALAVRARDQEVITRASHRGVDAADELGEELSVDVREQDTDRVRAARDEAARRAVRDVAERLDRGLDPGAGGVQHRALFVEDAGDRGHGDSSLSSHVPDRYAHRIGTLRILRRCKRLLKTFT